MKADLDETIENLNEGLQASKNSEVFSESRVQKPEVPAPTQADIEKILFWPQQTQNKACIAELSARYWFEIEGNIDNLYSWFINYLFFGLDFLLNDYHARLVIFITNDKFEQLRKPSEPIIWTAVSKVSKANDPSLVMLSRPGRLFYFDALHTCWKIVYSDTASFSEKANLHMLVISVNSVVYPPPGVLQNARQ